MDTEIVTDYGISDAVLSVNATYVVADAGILARYQDSDNYLLFQVLTNKLALWRRELGNWYLLDQTLDTPAVDDLLVFRLSGTCIEGWKNGQKLLRATEGFNRNITKHGLRKLHPDEDVLNNFTVASIRDAPPTPIAVRLVPMTAYYPDDPKYFDPEF